MASDRDDEEVGTAPTMADVASVHTLDVDPMVRASTSLGSTRFALREELGKGGMGRVVAADDGWLGRTVAIKQALGDDEAGLARFEREARITARLEHPAIVPIYDGGRDARGRPYYVMRKIAGESLAARIERAADLAQRLALVPNLLAAVEAAAFAHSHHIIHRDIKPWNILLGDYGETLLIDWGLARELGDSDRPSEDQPGLPNLTVAGRSMGTPGYMSPEQARGSAVDERTDVYALGATLWHLLEGRAVVTGADASAWLVEMRERDVPLGEVSAAVPAELRAIVAKATASADRRYRNAGEIAHDLRAFLDGRLVAAYAYTTRQLIARWLRRHRTVVLATVVALVATVTVTVYAFDRIVGERDEARAAREGAIDTNARINLTRAEQFVDRDPAYALAALRLIPEGSPHLAKARDLAAVAARNGVGIGIAAHTGAVLDLAVSRDGRWIASVGADSTVQVHDTTQRTSRVVSRIGDAGRPNTPSAVHLGWTDDASTLLVTMPERTRTITHAIDLRTGKTRELVASVLAPIGGDRVRYVDRDAHRLVEISLGDGAVRVMAEEVDSAAFDDDLAVVDGRAGVRVVGPSGVRALGVLRPDPFDVAAISKTLGRVALWNGEEITELDLETSAVVWRRRSKNDIPMVLLYADGKLWVHGYATAHAVSRGVEAFHAPTISRPTAVGGGLVASTGTEIAFRHGAYLGVMQHHATAIGGHPASRLLAVGTASGVIQWWPLTEPRSYELPASSELCGGTSERLIGLQAHTIVFELDRRTGAVQRLAEVAPALFCTQLHGLIHVPTAEVAHRPDGDVLRFSTSPTYKSEHQIVFPDGTVVRTPAEVFLDVPGGLVRSADRKALLDLESNRPVLVADRAMAVVWTVNGWIIASLDDGRLLRRSPAGVVDTLPLGRKPDAVHVTPDGALWLGLDRLLWRWGDSPELIASLPTTISRVFGDGRLVGLRDRSLWTIGEVRPTLVDTEVGDFRIGDHLLATNRMTHLELVHLDSHVRSPLFVDHRDPRHVLIDEHTQAIGVSSTPPMVFVYEDPVPRNPAELHRWIDEHTNARISGETLIWE